VASGLVIISHATCSGSSNGSAVVMATSYRAATSGNTAHLNW